MSSPGYMEIGDCWEERAAESERSGGGWFSNVLLKESGDIWKLSEFHEKNYHYGYERKKKGKKLLGRAVEASEEEKARHAARVNFRRKQKVIDLVNCNEQELDIWFTFTYSRNEQDLDLFHDERKEFNRRLGRFVRTGKLFDEPVRTFKRSPDFRLKAVGVIEFQDGERREDGEGRGAIHGHQLMNTPFLPQIRCIIADVFDSRDGTYKEAYLQKDGSFSLFVNRGTLWFSYLYEAEEFLKFSGKCTEDDSHVNFRVKSICVAAFLWECGHISIKKIEHLRKSKKMSNVGEYMISKYMVSDLQDERLSGRKAYFFTGKLAKPTFYRDPDDVENHLQALHMWVCQVGQIELLGDYIGAFTIYLFNFWVFTYPWIAQHFTKSNKTRGGENESDRFRVGSAPVLRE